MSGTRDWKPLPDAELCSHLSKQAQLQSAAKPGIRFLKCYSWSSGRSKDKQPITNVKLTQVKTHPFKKNKSEAKLAWAVNENTWYHYADRKFFLIKAEKKMSISNLPLLSSGIHLEQHNRECLPPPKHLRWLILKPAMRLRCGTECLSFQLPAPHNSPKTKANDWLTRVAACVVSVAAASSCFWRHDLFFHKRSTHHRSYRNTLSFLLPAAAACVILNMCKSLSGWQKAKERNMLM